LPLPVTTKQRMPGQQGSPFGEAREVPPDYVLPHGMWQVECSNFASVELKVFREFDDHGRPVDRASNERDTVTLLKQGGAGFVFADGWNVSIRGGTAWVVQVLGT
jgi:hypothetical protein